MALGPRPQALPPKAAPPQALDRHPIFWLEDPAYLLVVAGSALLTVAYARFRRPRESALLIADALGLAPFSIAGAQIAERAGVPALGGTLPGTVTGAAGGAVRDVLGMAIPLVLPRGNLYATAAIAGTAAYFALEAAAVARVTSTLIGMGIVVVVRFAAIWWRLQLPVFHLGSKDEHERIDGRSKRGG